MGSGTQAQPPKGAGRRCCAIVPEGDWGSGASPASAALGDSPVPHIAGNEGRSRDTFVLVKNSSDIIEDFEINRDTIELKNGLDFSNLGFDGDRVMFTRTRSGEPIATSQGVDTAHLSRIQFCLRVVG